MRCSEFILSVGGIGHVKPAPGTWASFVTVAAILLAVYLGAKPAHLTLGILTLATLMCVACVTLTRRVEEHVGRTDPGLIVADEVAGQALTLLLAPWHQAQGEFLWNIGIALSGFVLFRLFDIWKPWPIRNLQYLRAGWGVLLDDLAAAALAFGVLHVVMYFVDAAATG